MFILWWSQVIAMFQNRKFEKIKIPKRITTILRLESFFLCFSCLLPYSIYLYECVSMRTLMRLCYRSLQPIPKTKDYKGSWKWITKDDIAYGINETKIGAIKKAKLNRF